MLAPTRALQVQLQWPPYFLVLNLLETKATQVPKFHFYTETIYNHKTESFGIYDLENVSHLQRPKVRNSF